MAVLTQSGVTRHDVWKEGGASGRKFKAVECTLVLSAQGDTTDNIPASLFGMSKIVGARGFRSSSNARFDMIPSYTGAYLLYTAPDSAAATTTTGTIRGIVVGLE